jgi:hypothetical protein
MLIIQRLQYANNSVLTNDSANKLEVAQVIWVAM